MYLCILHERAAGAKPLDGGPFAYVDQVDPSGIQYPGGEVPGQHPGREHMEREGEYGEASIGGAFCIDYDCHDAFRGAKCGRGVWVRMVWDWHSHGLR